ncbi:type IV pilus modification PilV family protein [Thiolinea disciformis]|uniref:type IV pilus modification PilV family protein n=1 Tax=Thiolinea disciformis TaxID=125614 RepID=UPI0003724141|nr:prepilin-type N-terminal cleavage/methylation domain-containing protein [Thiolinea disciformis]
MGGLVRARSYSSGFTLLEILVAFVLMALVIGSLIQLFSGAMQSAALSEEYSAAIQVAESQLQTLGKEIPIQQGKLSGQVTGTRYQWFVDMVPLKLLKNPEASSLSLQAFQVTVQVRWDSAGKTRAFQLNSMRFGEEKP